MPIAKLYSYIFLYSVMAITLIYAMQLANKSYSKLKEGNNTAGIALLICIIAAIWIGQRPPTYAFSDTGNYAHTFELMKQTHLNIGIRNSSEWVWNNFTFMSSQVMDVNTYLTIIALAYFLFTFISCWLLTRQNVFATLLLVIGAFSFYSYATNGIRNGLACSMVLTVIALIAKPRPNWIIVAILAFLTAGIHKSTLLPMGCAFLSIFVIKNFKWAYIFWLFSIIISLVIGNSIADMFASMGFDDRLTYITTLDEDKFSYTGFRWDFLLYSMMPIVLGYYVVIKRGIKNKTYLVLLNTYTLANAFWVMVIRANYSNRFAYLSWFMYAMVLAYPLLSLDIWGQKQGKSLSLIMLANIGFTWVMAVFM